MYTSFTVEAGAVEGKYSTRTAGVINDTQIDVAPDGSYEITFGGPPRDRNWLALPDDAAALITRHYFEEPEPAAADPNKVIPLTIETVEPVGPARAVGRQLHRLRHQARHHLSARPHRRAAAARERDRCRRGSG